MDENQEAQPGCSKESELDKTKSWTKDDKFKLLQVLKVKGSNDIEGIKEVLPNKTPEEIKHIIALYKAEAVKHYNVDRRRKKTRQEVGSTKPVLPLSKWSQLLVEAIGYEELHTEVANALRIIAEVEYLPPAVFTDHIDFKMAYYLLANALEGKSLQVDKYVAALLNSTILETALTSKAFISQTTLQQILNDLEIGSESSSFELPTNNSVESVAIQHLAAQSNYNPLNIPTAYLKPSI